jgi:acid phosphatase
MKRSGFSALMTLALATSLSIGCVGMRPPNDDIPPTPSPANFPALPDGPSLNILVIGDWGTGGLGQREVARAIAKTHEDSPPAFVLTVGDNIYPSGVSGPYDPMWTVIFERVYAGPFWEDLIFYPTFGNHDHEGDLDGQIQYSEVSDRWHFPNHHYSFEKDTPGGATVLFLAFDTDPMLDGPRAAEEQVIWADSVFARTDRDWTVVFGHHPVASGGWHRPSNNVIRSVLPLLEVEADLYLAGHNHSTEFIVTAVGTPQAVCGGGAGTDNAYDLRPVKGTLASFTNGGWCYLRLWKEALVVELYDRGGGLQYRHLIRSRRD